MNEAYWTAIRAKLLNIAVKINAAEDDVQSVLLNVFSYYGLYPKVDYDSFWEKCLRNAKISRHRAVVHRSQKDIREYPASDISYVPDIASRSTVESWIDLLDMNDDPDVLEVLSLHCTPEPYSQTVRSRTLKLRKVLRERYIGVTV